MASKSTARHHLDVKDCEWLRDPEESGKYGDDKTLIKNGSEVSRVSVTFLHMEFLESTPSRYM
eukprot:gene21541-146_t